MQNTELGNNQAIDRIIKCKVIIFKRLINLLILCDSDKKKKDSENTQLMFRM